MFRFYFSAALLPALFAALLLCPACGSSSAGAVNSRADTSQLAAEVLQAPAPAGVPGETWQQLTAELSRVLRERGRTVSAPPLDEASAPPLFYDNTNSTLAWNYYSTGDYDQNGLVGISDLTPLGIHFGEESAPAGSQFPADSLLSLIDGDGNGVINIADVTPIGIGFGRRVEGYRVYSAPDESGYPEDVAGPNGAGAELISTLALVAAQTPPNGRRRFNLQVVPTGVSQVYWVRPFEGQQDGAASNLVSVVVPPNEPPQAGLVPVDDAAVPARIEWNAIPSTDSDGSIVKFEWDFDNDGVFEHESGAEKVRPFYYYAPGDYTVRVRVTDDDGATGTTSGSVAIDPGKTWQQSLVVEGTSLSVNSRVVSDETALLEVEGHPALAYLLHQDTPDPFNDSEFALVYARADDPDGTQWPEPQILDTRGAQSGSSGPALIKMIEDKPAFVYNVQKQGEESGHFTYQLIYRRSLDNLGAQWPEGLVIHEFENLSGNYTGVPLVTPETLEVTANRLVVLGRSSGVNPVSMIESSDPLGGQWLDGILSGSPGYTGDAVRLIGDEPAIVRDENSQDILLYRANHDVQAPWSAAELVDELEQASDPHLVILADGLPALAYYDSGLASIKLRRGLDETGANWTDPVVISARGSDTMHLKIVNGRPVMLFVDRISDTLEYITANDEIGNYWSFPARLPEELAFPSRSSFNSRIEAFADVNGLPAWTIHFAEELSPTEFYSALHYVTLR